MTVFRTAIVHSMSDAARRLEDFGLTIAQILAVRDAGRAAADDASPLMPLNAPGTLAYIRGVEALREQLLDEHWIMDRSLGVEAVLNHELGIRIGYQNVDRACDPVLKPMPRSAKGPASERMCNFPLFEHYGMILQTDKDRLPTDLATEPHSDQIVSYFVMVGEDGSVELSSPIIGNQRYSGFRERIFVDRPEEDWENQLDSDDLPDSEIEILVSLKETK